MNKEEFVTKRGQEAYDKKLESNRERTREWNLNNPEKIEEHHHERDRKGGKNYPKKLEYDHTGLQGERNKVRHKHGHMWRPYKKIIAPDSQIHHEWKPGTAEYDGVALVEKNQHQYGDH